MAEPVLRPLRHLAWLLVCGPLLAGAAGPLRIFTQPFQIPERGFVTSYTALTESNRFNFVPPDRWLARADEADRSVTLQPANHAAGLVVRWLDVRTNSIPADRTNFWQELALERHTGGVITRQFHAYTRSGKAEAFDLLREGDGGRRVAVRVAYLAHEHGVVEFTLTTQAERSQQYHLVFGHLLGSFRVEPWSSSSAPESAGTPTAPGR